MFWFLISGSLCLLLIYGAGCWYIIKVRNTLVESELCRADLRSECQRLQQELPNRKAELEEANLELLQQQQNRLSLQFEEDHVHTISQATSSWAALALQSQMKILIEKTYSRMSQEFLGSVGDNTDAFLVDLNDNLVNRVWDHLQQVKELGESPFVFPGGTKMAYTKGCRTVFAIEQPPQVRSVVFDGKLVSQGEREHGQKATHGYRFGLAFPYVYFFVIFDNQYYAYHEVYFRNKSLTSPREHLYTAPLPNLCRDAACMGAACMGAGFDPQSEGSMARQAEKAVSEFWQRSFNEHLGNGGKIDKRISNYAHWQARTQKDPLFILNMKWGRGNTAHKIIDRILKGRNSGHDTDVLDKEARKLLEKGVKGIIKTIKTEIDSAKKNHTLRSGNLDEVVKEKLLEVVTEHSRRVFANCSEINHG